MKIKKLLPENFLHCYDLLDIKSGELDYFKKLGWTFNQFYLQLFNQINFGLGLFKEEKLEAFIIGNLITIEKKLEYEILLIYVTIKRRKVGYATKLLNNLPIFIKKNSLKKIYLEVAANNHKAIQLYKKNKYQQIGTRKKYYIMKNKKIDAIFFEKIIND